MDPYVRSLCHAQRILIQSANVSSLFIKDRISTKESLGRPFHPFARSREIHHSHQRHRRNPGWQSHWRRIDILFDRAPIREGTWRYLSRYSDVEVGRSMVVQGLEATRQHSTQTL